MWWQQGALRRALDRDRPDVVFAPAYTAPLLRRTPVVLALHDVSFAAHPEWFSWHHGMQLRTLSRLSARAAAEVLTLSEFSKQEIVEHVGIAPGRMRIVRLGVSARFAATAPLDARPPLVLFVGTLLNRRHLPDLVRAFAPVARRHPDATLVLVGRNRTDPHEDPAAVAAQLDIAAQVDVTSYVTDERLLDLYSRARAFAYLSSYEGFAMTPLEAMSAGLPALLLDTPVAREVYGDAALFVPSGDLDRTTLALERLLYEPGLGQALLARAPALLTEHTWAQAASQVMDALERAAGRAARAMERSSL